MPTLRILLDECLDRRLRSEFPDHLVKTVPEMGWNGMKNGMPLGRAENNFDVFMTADRNLTFQQQISRFKIIVVVLHALTNRAEDLRPLASRALKMMASASPGQIIHIS